MAPAAPVAAKAAPAENGETPKPVRSATPPVDAPAAKAAPTADSAAPKTGSAFDGDWFGLTRRLNGAVKQLASLCELAGHAPGMLSLRLPEAHKGLLDGFGDKLRLAICEQIGKDTRIDIELGRTQGDSPAEITARAKAERQSEAEAAIYADPFVQALIEQGGGTVTDIHPLQQ